MLKSQCLPCIDVPNPGNFKFPLWWFFRVHKIQDKALAQSRIHDGRFLYKVGFPKDYTFNKPLVEGTINKFPYVTCIVWGERNCPLRIHKSQSSLLIDFSSTLCNLVGRGDPQATDRNKCKIYTTKILTSIQNS